MLKKSPVPLTVLILDNPMWLDPRRYEVIDDQMAEILRGKTPQERLNIANGMWHMARELIADKLRMDHPDWNDPQVAAETARRMASGSG